MSTCRRRATLCGCVYPAVLGRWAQADCWDDVGLSQGCYSHDPITPGLPHTAYRQALQANAALNRKLAAREHLSSRCACNVIKSSFSQSCA